MAFVVNCKHILDFVLIVYFEQASVPWVDIEKTNTFEGKIRYMMHYFDSILIVNKIYGI